ncbi:MAG: tRNA pseudouridine(38-40) synthase TruA [Proteobacteria bacterium]|nr:tRNA pseudouridine(38-40) synthase TruA [Pseudomonadota bacterium]
MPRYKLLIEYDGGGFVGWQRQVNGFSVQEAIERAIGAFSGEAVTLTGAGRTDSGVHALGQCAHFEIAKSFPPDTVRDAVNAHLKPHRITILGAEEVAPDFDARRSAKARLYRYRIVNRRSPLTLDAGRAWQVITPLDAKAMDEAAKRLEGRHDFSTFRASECQASSPVKTLDRLEVLQEGETIWITAQARSFLHSQMRIMVGSLRLVGDGKWTATDLGAALHACDRRRGGPTAPAEGLYLAEVVY